MHIDDYVTELNEIRWLFDEAETRLAKLYNGATPERKADLDATGAILNFEISDLLRKRVAQYEQMPLAAE